MENCETCDYFRKSDKVGAPGNCFNAPPVLSFIPMEMPVNASAIQRGGMPSVQMVPASARPQVFMHDGCARHAMRKEIVN